VPIDLYRIDDRLIHGQVIVGWGQPMDLGFVVLVDDEVAGSEWERELYRMGVPPDVALYFASVDDAVAQLDAWRADARHGILITGDIDTMRRLTERAPAIREVNVGGVHHRPGRTERLRYLFLSVEEEQALRAMEARGVTIIIRDVPSARALRLGDLAGAAKTA
jgi:mannose/fructose/N-acetylgalactosamine-specific phosphotransferase system component IIB